VNNVVAFPAARVGVPGNFNEIDDVSGGEHRHAVQFYDSDDYLIGVVARFLLAGLWAGDRVVVVATPGHVKAVLARIHDLAPELVLPVGRITFLDARQSLDRFMGGELPDPVAFRRFVARMVGLLGPTGRGRVYGEMVDLLYWQDGNSAAALRLEQLWNEAQQLHGFSLLCGYVMGHFYNEGDGSRFLEVCQAHTHVIPTEEFGNLDTPLARLREISVLQQRARVLQAEIQRRQRLEQALLELLKGRARDEEELRASARREKEARQAAAVNDAFKETLLGILGHDLRNPLNAVLTTARIMLIAAEGSGACESERRLERIVSSGVRMQRLIGQLLDVARAQLAGGIPIADACTQDLRRLVDKVIEEVRATHPARRIESDQALPCAAHVDADRFEQVASNLIGNAIIHGDPAQPITVTLSTAGGMTTFSVHNFGKPIDPALMPVIFDPFKRAGESRGRPDSLGLGLYIVERIVIAHGGRMEVLSSAHSGTRFTASFRADAVH
jgi:signal transduction histidine kinase